MPLIAKEKRPLDPCPACGGHHDFRCLSLYLDDDTQEAWTLEFPPCDPDYIIKQMRYSGVALTHEPTQLNVPGVIESVPLNYVPRREVGDE